MHEHGTGGCGPNRATSCGDGGQAREPGSRFDAGRIDETGPGAHVYGWQETLELYRIMQDRWTEARAGCRLPSGREIRLSRAARATVRVIRNGKPQELEVTYGGSP